MTMKTIFAAAAFALAMAAPAVAVPINLDFSFGAVSGKFFGLDDEVVGTQSATSFDFNGAFDVYSGLIPDVIAINSFEFTDGDLTFADFSEDPFALGNNGTGFLDSLSFFNLAGEILGSASETDLVFNSIGSTGTATFTATPVSSVPLPAGGLFLLTGLAGVAAVKRRKKPAA
ncbi:MAG: VPLPA-CTERM sorting domain-containing protein [Paracoccaceae bacterium]